MNGRDLRIDFMRGLALLMISIDHAPWNVLSLTTLHAYSFADAAELFFFMSGYVAALVYGRTLSKEGLLAAMARIYRRARDLYLTQIALLIAVAAFLYAYAAIWEDNSVIDNFRLAPLIADPLKMMVHALTLRYQPTYMDILPGYVVIFLALPFLLWLLQRNVWAALGISFAVYLGVQIEGWTLYTKPDSSAWLFDPFAWQFLFTLGAAFGSGRLSALLPVLRSRKLIAASAVFAVVVAVMVGSSAWHAFFPSVPSLWFVNVSVAKETLQPLRIISFLALAHLGWRFIPSGAALMRFELSRAIIICGQQSLSIFSAGVLLSAAGSVLWGDWQSQIAVCAATLASVALLMAFARVLDWAQRGNGIFNRAQSTAAA